MTGEHTGARSFNERVFENEEGFSCYGTCFVVVLHVRERIRTGRLRRKVCSGLRAGPKVFSPKCRGLPFDGFADMDWVLRNMSS